MDWTFCENDLGTEIIQGPNAAVTHLMCGFSINIEIHIQGGLQQEQKLGYESGPGDWPFFELMISNMYTLNDLSWIQMLYPVSLDIK
jgi:hypothetical protein